MKNFGILTGVGEPLFGYYLEAIKDYNLYPTIIIVDQKPISKKDLEIFFERTSGNIIPKPPSLFINNSYYEVNDHNSPETLNLIKNHRLDFLISATTPRILKTHLLNAAPYGILNCHPGLLPFFRGCSSPEWAIYFDKPLGITVHQMVENIDEGPILLKRQINVSKFENYENVRTKIYKACCNLLAEASFKLSSGILNEIDFITQKEGKYYPPMTSEILKIVKNKLKDGLYFSIEDVK